MEQFLLVFKLVGHFTNAFGYNANQCAICAPTDKQMSWKPDYCTHEFVGNI